ncbi:hypothetical protein PR003_g14190 [Phytophthora rubi]|uniref:Uncharacterized protein n=1 Tax=Phytophthora rubi TaxID=129364 RepID=A0A6A4F623_9STRA|nr:hypothetical protein PF003_g25166 [Phytophthora fragariae]KAE9333093.1 hypothetical protein PR003_g14190 [Phytophthora rubi]
MKIDDSVTALGAIDQDTRSENAQPPVVEMVVAAYKLQDYFRLA